MKKFDDVYRRQIVDATAKIERFVAGLDKDAFFASEVVQSAVIMQLAVIGEAVEAIVGRIQGACFPSVETDRRVP